MMAAIMACMLALLEWYQWFVGTPPQPIVYTLIALMTIGLFVIKFLSALRKVRPLKLARDGERVAGQYLDNLREGGYRILHDLVGDKFNIDHVLIGPAGVFTVETKTISKPGKGQAEIEYDGEHLRVGGFVPDRDPPVPAYSNEVLMFQRSRNWINQLVEQI